MACKGISISQPFLIDTKGTCLLCYRECSYRKSTSRKDHVQHKVASERFSKLFSRYLKCEFQQVLTAQFMKLKKKRKRNMENVTFELCDDCCILAGSFSNLYAQLELIQMRLDSSVKTISEIMTVAGRIPSRIRAYQERMGLKPEVGDTSEKRKAVGSAVRTAAMADCLRKALISKCFERIRSSTNCPRVKLYKEKRSELKDANAPNSLSESREKSNRHINSAVDSSNSPLRPPLSTSSKNELIKTLSSLLVGCSFSLACIFSLASWDWKSLSVSISSGTPSKTQEIRNCDDVAVLTNLEPEGIANNCDANAQATSGQVLEIAGGSQQPIAEKRNTITITDSGKTVLLPHQTFKTDCEEFVDESLMDEAMDCEDTYADFINNSSNFESNEPLDMCQTIMTEPEQSFLPDNENTCAECRIELSSRAELEKHRAVIHKLQAYVQCPTCKQMFASYHFLKCHRKDSEMCAIDEAAEKLEIENVARPLFPFSSTIRGNKFCPMEGCFEVFLKQDALDVHLKAHGTFKCNSCETKFEKAHDLALHESQNHSGCNFSGYKCTRCNFHVGGQYAFIVHFLDVHLNIAVYNDHCKICKFGFTGSTAQAQTLHFKVNHDVAGKDPKSIFKCTLCDAPFLKKTQLAKHQMYIHNMQPDKRRQCGTCGEVLPSSNMLREHRLRAHSDKPDHEVERLLKSKRKESSMGRKLSYECYCGRSFASKSSLLLHSKVHEQLEKEMDKHNPGGEEDEDDDDTGKPGPDVP